MINRLQKAVLLKRAEIIRSSAIVERTLVVARYAPMIPVKIAARAVTAISRRPPLPMMLWAAKKVGTVATPSSASRLAIYSCQDG